MESTINQPPGLVGHSGQQPAEALSLMSTMGGKVIPDQVQFFDPGAGRVAFVHNHNIYGYPLLFFVAKAKPDPSRPGSIIELTSDGIANDNSRVKHFWLEYTKRLPEGVQFEIISEPK